MSGFSWDGDHLGIDLPGARALFTSRQIGTPSRAAFIKPQIALAVPTVTCTMTAAGLPQVR